jgi:hypothetical protein
LSSLIAYILETAVRQGFSGNHQVGMEIAFMQCLKCEPSMDRISKLKNKEEKNERIN